MESIKDREEKILEDNNKVFALLSRYLNQAPDFITKEEMDDISNNGVSSEYAFAVILAAAFGLDIVDHAADKELFNHYFIKMIHQLDANEYDSNPYYKNISIPTIGIGNSELKYEKYKPFEGFVCNDIIITKEGRQVPQIGFFESDLRFRFS
jgi:hypothetical protein